MRASCTWLFPRNNTTTSILSRRILINTPNFISFNTNKSTSTSSASLLSSIRMSSSSSTAADPSTMKIGEIKAEIESLGATDKLFQGMEKSDLIQVLENARKNPAKSAASGGNGLSALINSTYPNAKRRADSLQYGKFKLVGNTTRPSALVSCAHGLGDNCEGWAQAMQYEVAPHLPHVLFMLPTAANQPVTMNMGAAMPSWYDLRGLGARSEEDPEGVAISCEYVERKALETCKQFNIDTNRICLAGFSQGSAVSLALGLISKAFKPAGIAVLSGYLAGREFVVPNIVNGDVPIQQFHGTADPMVNIQLAHKSKEMLEETGKVKNILPIKSYRGMQHSSSAEEMVDFVEFLKKVLPAKY